MKTVTVVILDGHACRLAQALDEDTAVTLIGVVSEDPSCWHDMAACWPRYRTPVVPEFADSLPLQAVDYDTAREALEQHDAWVVLDLNQKRIITGRDFEPTGRDQTFAMVDEANSRRRPLSVHLPPWWDLHEQSAVDVLDGERERPLTIPRVDRAGLFGEMFLNDLAARILNAVGTESWLSSRAAEDARARYSFTLQVHRDWLMTPRQELGGLMPRQMLHGAQEWIDQLADAQRIRVEVGDDIVALPTSVSGYEHAPMGSQEMIIYFDLCRELIEAGWHWCLKHAADFPSASDQPHRQRELATFLSEVKQQWLNSSFEGGSPPQFIIECSRRRVPRAAGVPIIGMADVESEKHVLDCDCPICIMMAEGMFGPSFTCLDGHHLDLDDEFAFSMHETREAWEEQQREFAEFSASMEDEPVESAAGSEAEPDEFASAWSAPICDEPLPGDPLGHLKLAFLLAEVVSELQSEGASQEDVKQLNLLFTNLWKCEKAGLAACGEQLGSQLEVLAMRFPKLVSRVADLQSRLDAHVRCPAFGDD